MGGNRALRIFLYFFYQKFKKMRNGRFPPYGSIWAEFRFNSFRFLQFFKFPFLIKNPKRCARVDCPPTGLYEQSFGLIPLDSYSSSSFHFWSYPTASWQHPDSILDVLRNWLASWQHPGHSGPSASKALKKKFFLKSEPGILLIGLETGCCILVVTARPEKRIQKRFLAYLGFWHLGTAKSANKLMI